MDRWFHIGYSLVAIAGVWVLCTVFESDKSFVHGLVMGKVSGRNGLYLSFV
jgi:uncharacterized membrane protein YuzA (DUF378 family)